MSIEGIIGKINSEADARIRELEEETRKSIADLDAEVAEYESAIISDAEERAKAEAERRFGQVLNREEAELRKGTLAVKQELVNEAFDKGLKAIMELPQDELRRRYADMVVSFGENEGELVIGKADNDLLGDEFLRLLSEKLPGANFSRNVSDEFDHGLMLIAGKVQYDARLSELFAALKERITDKVAAVLFPTETEAKQI